MKSFIGLTSCFFRFDYTCPAPTDTAQYGSYPAPPPKDPSTSPRPVMSYPTSAYSEPPPSYPAPMYHYQPEAWQTLHQPETFQPPLPMHHHPAFLQREPSNSPGPESRPMVQASMLSQAPGGPCFTGSGPIQVKAPFFATSVLDFSFPAVAVLAGVADGQDVPTLHRLDRRRLGVQDGRP